MKRTTSLVFIILLGVLLTPTARHARPERVGVMPATGMPIQLQNGTATFSSIINETTSPDQAVDGIFDSANGWHIARVDAFDGTTSETAVWETATDLNASTLVFTMHFLHSNPGHLLGRFRFSVTTDDRSTFADGLDAGGDVDANWIVLDNPSVQGPAGMTFTTLFDNSVLAGGTTADQGIYTVTYSTTVSGITGLRLETLEDTTLPGGNGPGLFPRNGNFFLTEMTLDVESSVCVTPPPGLVSWWPGDSSGTDIIGGQALSAQGTATFGPARVGDGFKMVSGGDVFNAPDSPIWHLQQLTIDAWVRATSAAPVHPVEIGGVIVDKLAVPHRSWLLTYQPANGQFLAGVSPGFITGDPPDFVQSATGFAAGQFHHVAMTYDGTTLKLYVNGVFQAERVMPGPIQYNDMPLGIGAQADSPFQRTLFGEIDEVEIYNRALSQSELQAIFNAGSAGKCKVLSVAPIFLHGIGPNNNPPTLFLDASAPSNTAAKFKDSTPINFSGVNPWKEVGVWPAEPSLTAGLLTALSELRVWLGLKNSDDQGTNFDVRAEVYKNGELVAAGETYCIQGVTRNANLAKEVVVPFAPFAPVTFNGATDELSLKVLTRIGSDGAGGFCGGHSNAVGLRLYFDSVSRPSTFNATIAP